MTLTWWTPEFLSPTAPQPAGPLLAEQLKIFSRANADKIQVNVVRKARYGKGGLLDFLRAAGPVAPGVLPDLIALDAAELEAAAATGLLRPLDGLLDEQVTGDLYPFARSAGQFGGQLLAVQYAADFDHLIYRRDLLPTPPATWDELLAAPVAYALPLNNQASGGSQPGGLSEALLSQYLSAGAAYDLKARQLELEAEPLLRLFTFYQAAFNGGFLPDSPLQTLDAASVWNRYNQGQAALAHVSARRYLAEGSQLKETMYAAAPGQAGPLKPIASGWALAIVTPDPARQRAAATLITWLLEPARQGAWSAAAGWLPTSPTALEGWGDAAYLKFLDEQLAGSVSFPAGPDSARSAAAIKQGLEAVIKGESSPQAAAETSMNTPK